MRKHRFFITATGTEIGKTFFTCALLNAARAKGLHCHAIKPVVAGFIPEEPLLSDTGLIIQSLGLSHDEAALNSVSPWRYQAPVSPALAAKREGDTIDFTDLTEFCLQSAARPTDLFLIEGVGGAMVPLDDTRTVLDWMETLDIPVILLAGNYLGSVSHTLATLSALSQRRIQVKALVINESQNPAVSLTDTIGILKNFVKQIPIFPLYRNNVEAINDAAFSDIFNFLIGNLSKADSKSFTENVEL